MGGIVEENLSKTEGNRRTRPAFLHNILKFFDTSRGGGSEAPTRQLARWGLLLIFHRTYRTSLIKIQTIRLVPVLRLLLHERYGPTLVLMIL